MGAAAGQYFEPDPSVPSRRRSVELHLPDLSLRLTTDSGVFAAGAVDPGTKLLLLEAGPRRDAGTLLDLGCGYGTIALSIARRAPAAMVWAVDVNSRARQLCAQNALANGITNVTVAAPDDVPHDVQLDEIWSNPPIRIGKPALHDLLLTWLPRLVPDGRGWLVVQKHLGADSLVRWLADAGWPTQRVASRGGYRILVVQRGP